MKWKSKIVVITNANMNLQSGNVTLVERRAKAMYDLGGQETICLLLKYKEFLKDEKWISYRYVSFDRDKIASSLREIKPDKVIFYGTTPLIYISLIKRIFIKEKIKVQLICDIQGAPEELIEFKKGFDKLKSFPKLFFTKLLLKHGILNSDASFVVSTEMKKYIYELVGPKIKKNYKFYKIRCGVDKYISLEQKKVWREKIRRQLGIDNNTYVFVFSGYRMPWQKIDEILNVFKYYDKNYKNVFFALFCNIDDEFSKKIEQMFPKKNYILKFLKQDEYFEYLSACDLGFLLRDKKITNRVAFPNKFSDYLNAGLVVAMNDSVFEPFEILKKYEVDYVNTKNIENIEYLENIMYKRKSNLYEYYKKTEEICKIELSYESQIRNEKVLE